MVVDGSPEVVGVWVCQSEPGGVQIADGNNVDEQSRANRNYLPVDRLGNQGDFGDWGWFK